MSTATATHENVVVAPSKAAGKSFFARVFDAMSRRAEQNAMARLAALDPRLANEIRAARDRCERELANPGA